MWIFVYLKILFLAVVLVSGNCPVGSLILNDTAACYWLSGTKQDHSSSKTICNFNQLKLAFIPNEAANTEVSKYITSALRSTDDKKVWIGVNDMETERVFKNSDGSNTTYTNWHQSNTNNEPNDLGLADKPAEDCVAINKEGEWFDEPCTKTYKALCYTTIPTPLPTSTTPLPTSTTPLPTSTTLPPQSTTTMTNQETTRVMIDKLLIPVIIAVSVVFLLVLIIVVICIARKRISRKTKTDKYESPLEKKKETREDEYDMLHKNRLNIENMESSNLYDHTNMNSELYDSAIQNKINSDLDGKNRKQQRAQNYDISSVAVLEKDNVYYSSAKFRPDGDDMYGETNEGEYDVLNKRRNKQEPVKDQIYSHTGTDEAEYDLTIMNPNENIVNDDTYDSTRNTTKDNTYDTMETR